MWCRCDTACCSLSWPSSGQWFDFWSPAHFLSFACVAIYGQFAARIWDRSNLVRFPNLTMVHISRCRVRRGHARHDDAPFVVHSRRLSRTVFSPGPQCAFACVLHPRSVANDLSNTWWVHRRHYVVDQRVKRAWRENATKMIVTRLGRGSCVVCGFSVQHSGN